MVPDVLRRSRLISPPVSDCSMIELETSMSYWLKASSETNTVTSASAGITVVPVSYPPVV